MGLSTTDIKVLKVFVNDISKEYSISEISRLSKSTYARVHSSVKRLAGKGIVNVRALGKSRYCRLEYKGNMDIACYIESLSARDFPAKNKKIKLFIDNFKEKFSEPSYTLAAFGSYANGKQGQGSDVDVAIIAAKQAIKKAETLMNSISKLSTLPIHLVSFTYSELIKMLRPKKLMVGKEIASNHIIFHGCEQFYECLRLT